MEVTVDTRELVALERRLALAGKATQGNIRKLLSAVGARVLGKAKEIVPESMNKTEYIRTLKTGVTKRRNFHKGDLKRSIKMELKTDSVEIGVASNSLGGSYAEKIHEEWKRTPHNPEPKQDRYIFGAYEIEQDRIEKTMEVLVEKIIAAI